MMTYNPEYYHEMLINAGMQKACDFFAYKITRKSFKPEAKVQRVYERIQNKLPLKIRSGNLKNFDEELETIRELYNEAFSGHWGFSAISKKEFDFMGKELKSIVDTNLVLVAEYKGQPIGFLLAVPNLSTVLKKLRMVNCSLLEYLKYYSIPKKLIRQELCYFVLKKDFNL